MASLKLVRTEIIHNSKFSLLWFVNSQDCLHALWTQFDNPIKDMLTII